MAAKDDNPFCYYVYVLFDWRGWPFYVGKGKGYRMQNHWYSQRVERGGAHRKNIINKTLRLLGSVPSTLIRNGLTESEALTLEVIFIKAIGRRPDGPLVNGTDGGEGGSGRHLTPEGRAAIGAKVGKKNTGRIQTEAEKRRRSESGKGRIVTDETRGKISAKQRGKTISAESRELMRQAALRRWSSEDERKRNAERVREAHQRLSQEEKDELRAKRSVAVTAWWATKKKNQTQSSAAIAEQLTLDFDLPDLPCDEP